MHATGSGVVTSWVLASDDCSVMQVQLPISPCDRGLLLTGVVNMVTEACRLQRCQQPAQQGPRRTCLCCVAMAGYR
jgi:hypothetical protein